MRTVVPPHGHRPRGRPRSLAPKAGQRTLRGLRPHLHYFSVRRFVARIVPRLNGLRDNHRLQARLRLLAASTWALILLALLIPVTRGTQESAQELGRAAVYLGVASVAGYHALKFAGRGFALLTPALFFLAALVVALLTPLASANHDGRAAQLPEAEADLLLDALCDPALRALPEAQQVEILSGRSHAFRALDSGEQAKVLKYPGFQPANCSSHARPSQDPAGRRATSSAFCQGLGVLFAFAAASAYAVWRAMRSCPGLPTRVPAPDRPVMPENSDDATLAILRQNLRLKVLYDEAKIERLIDFERQQNPRASAAELLSAAIERWERHNR